MYLSVQEVLMYAGVVEENKNAKGLRLEYPPELNGPWKELCRRKGITQTGAIVRLIEFVLAQDDVAQSMVLGQVDQTPELIRHVLENIGRRGNGFPKAAAKSSAKTTKRVAGEPDKKLG